MRLIDHFVLVTESLSDVGKYYRRLGFNVAPAGVHPFGTHNANMYFRDGPMVETLAIENHTKYTQAIDIGNTFVKNDAAYRAANGNDGFSHIVVTSTDAEKDHAGFLARGVSGGDLVAFSRQFEQPDGTIDEVAAKLAFAKHEKARTGFYFTCEDVVIPEVDRSSLLDHENGTLGANRVISCAREPAVFIDFLHDLFQPNEVSVNGTSLECSFPNGHASILTPKELEQNIGVKHNLSGEGLVHAGLVFDVDDLQKVTALFMQNQVQFRQHNDHLVTQFRSNQSPFFIFKQHRN